MRLMLMAHDVVGLDVFDWVLREYPEDLSMVVATADDEILVKARAAGIDCCVFEGTEALVQRVRARNLVFDLGVLAWWPKLIKAPLIDVPEHGFVNTHPSLLPHNRGKHYNFWALAEQAPFGVSLHFVDHGVDSGDVIAQREIHYDWEDTGATLYFKAQAEMLELFRAEYPRLRSLQITRRTQELEQGSFRRGSEMEKASEIHLDQSYRARDLLNLLRARTFPGHPACRFIDEGQEYEVQVNIERMTS